MKERFELEGETRIDVGPTGSEIDEASDRVMEEVLVSDGDCLVDWTREGKLEGTFKESVALSCVGKSEEEMS